VESLTLQPVALVNGSINLPGSKSVFFTARFYWLLLHRALPA